MVRGGLLSAFAPTTVGRTADGLVVQAFDAGEGVVVGPLPGARGGAGGGADGPCLIDQLKESRT